jgi:hypothetical protein
MLEVNESVNHIAREHTRHSKCSVVTVLLFRSCTLTVFIKFLFCFVRFQVPAHIPCRSVGNDWNKTRCIPAILSLLYSVWNIFEVASSSDSYADHYVITRKLLDSVLNVRWKPKSPYRRSRWTHRTFLPQDCLLKVWRFLENIFRQPLHCVGESRLWKVLSSRI